MAWIVALLLVPHVARAGIADARASARAGVDLDALHVSPGAPVPGEWRLQLAGARPFAGTDLHENAVRLHVSRPYGAVALGFEQRRSSVHRDDVFVGALQMQRSLWRVGVGVRFRRLTFAGYESRWRSEPRFGASIRLGVHSLIARFLPQPFTHHLPRLDWGARFVWHRSAIFYVQNVREPGLPGRLRGAVSLQTSALSVHSGYDVATGVVAAGIEAGTARVRLVYAVQSHPDLSWSHTWMLEFGPAWRWR